MKIYIKYNASSNISYRGVWEMDVEPEYWKGLTGRQRQDAIDEFAQECLFDDIEWHEEEHED